MHYTSTSPTPFIGWQGYPTIQVGFLSHQEKQYLPYDDPRAWAQQHLPLPQLISYRKHLTNHYSVHHIKKVADIAQDIALSKRSLDVEVTLKEKPWLRLHTSPYTAPYGPKAHLKTAILASSPRIERSVDKAHSDTDLPASQALNHLYTKGIDETRLTRLLSTATLGTQVNRKIVPTRWSITAVDDTIGKNMSKNIINNDTLPTTVCYDHYLGNHYIILLLEDNWSFELFETSLKHYNRRMPTPQRFGHDYEYSWGRKTYASQTAGGYYATRLPILEKLKALKKQAKVIVFRFVTKEYTTPMGVWVVREAVRKTLQKSITFDNPSLALDYCDALVTRRLSYDLHWVRKHSILLNNQKKLTHFFGLRNKK